MDTKTQRDIFAIAENTLQPGSKRDKTHDLPVKRVQARVAKNERKNGVRQLHKQFISRLAADFRKNGIAAIESVRTENPVEYLKIITRILPKELNVNLEHSFVDVLNEANAKIQARKEEKDITGEFEVVNE